MKLFITPVICIALLTTSCVSKKRYVALESQHIAIKGTLQKTTIEKDKLSAKFEKIERRVASYNKKISSLESDNVTLEKENDVKLDKVGNVAVLSNRTREKMNITLAKVDPTAVTRTVVPPYVTITAPSACRAIFPVSKVNKRPPHVISFLYTSNILLSSTH